MKNSPYMKIKKWENQLNRFCIYALKCVMSGALCKKNKKRYDMIIKNIDNLIDKKLCLNFKRK